MLIFTWLYGQRDVVSILKFFGTFDPKSDFFEQASQIFFGDFAIDPWVFFFAERNQPILGKNSAQPEIFPEIFLWQDPRRYKNPPSRLEHAIAFGQKLLL